MIIQGILICGLFLCLVYAYLQRRNSRWISIAISATSIAGVYFVLVPERTTEIARLLGVGRGADLILYCWIVISLIVSVSLQFKILNLQEAITELTRELALRAPLGAGSKEVTDARIP
jgi:hypothetical protein